MIAMSDGVAGFLLLFVIPFVVLSILFSGMNLMPPGPRNHHDCD